MNKAIQEALKDYNWDVPDADSPKVRRTRKFNANEESVPSIFKDLVAIPDVRPVAFQCMRAPERSEAFSKAIGQLFHKA